MIANDQPDPRLLAEAERVLTDAGLPPTIVRTALCGRQPSLGRLRPVKDLLVAHLGADAAARAFAQLAGHELGDVRRLPITGLLEFARVHAKSFHTVSHPRRAHMPAVRVVGDDGRRGFDVDTRTVFCCALDDAVVSSKSNVIVAGGRALLDYQPGELALVPLDLAVDPTLFAPGNGEATVAIGRGACDGTLVEQAFTLLGVNSFNYWHWHVEFLPRLLACREIEGFSDWTILVDAQMPAQSMEALRFMVGAEHPVRVVQPGEAVRVRRLWTCSMFMYLPVWPMPGITYAPRTMFQDTVAFAAQIKSLGPALSAVEAAGPRRLYLGRGASLHRGMANRDAVEAWFVAHGFVVVDFAALSFEAQLQHVRGAELIVGPNGAAFVNTLFARPGTAIGILDNPFIEDNEWYADLCSALGQRLLFLSGQAIDEDAEYEFNANYLIDVDRLPAFLHRLTDGP